MIAIRGARPGEGAVIARYIRASLPPSIEGLTIWHCRHVDRWVETHLAAPGSSTFYIAVDEGDQTIAAAEFRTNGDTVFLNQIGVSPARQGEGIGGRLLAAGLRDLSRSGAVASLALDVETANERAVAWYRRLGLAPVSRTYWMLSALRPDGVPPATVHGWEQAQQEYARFGFARFEVGGEGGPYSVGLLGERLFRLTTEAAWRDPAVHGALDRIDTTRRLLLIGGPPSEAGRLIRRADRLRGPIGPALAKLPTP